MNCTVVGKTASQLLWRHSGYSTPSEGVRDAYPRYGYPKSNFERIYFVVCVLLQPIENQ